MTNTTINAQTNSPPSTNIVLSMNLIAFSLRSSASLAAWGGKPASLSTSASSDASSSASLDVDVEAEEARKAPLSRCCGGRSIVEDLLVSVELGCH